MGRVIQKLHGLALGATALISLAGCPLPFDYAGKGGGTHTTDPSSPRMTAPLTVSYAEQAGPSGTIANEGSLLSGNTTTVTLSTTTDNATIYYSTDGKAITDFKAAHEVSSSSGHLTLTRGWAFPGFVDSVTCHSVIE